MAKTTTNVQISLTFDTIEWLECNCIKKSTLIQKLLKEYIKEQNAKLK